MNNIALAVDQTRAEGFIGASDAACALGLSQYKAPITLWRELRGEEVNDNRPAYVNEAAEFGQQRRQGAGGRRPHAGRKVQLCQLQRQRLRKPLAPHPIRCDRHGHRFYRKDGRESGFD